MKTSLKSFDQNIEYWGFKIYQISIVRWTAQLLNVMHIISDKNIIHVQYTSIFLFEFIILFLFWLDRSRSKMLWYR